MYMSKTYSEKLEKHLWRGLFYKNCRITYHSLLKVKSNKKCLARNLTKVFLAALKNKKSFHDDNEGKSAFQTIAIELYKQPKNNQKKNT